MNSSWVALASIGHINSADMYNFSAKKGNYAKYKVVLKTSNKKHAGTNDWVYLTIIGSNGKTHEVGLDIPKYNDMKYVCISNAMRGDL